MICHKNKYIFIHIPRTGGTAIELALTGVKIRMHMDWKEAKEKYAEYWDSYFKFSIARNPFDWLPSIYYLPNREEVRNVTFDEFVANPRLLHYEPKTAIQSDIMGPEMDYVMRFENLQQDFNTLCQVLKIPQGPERQQFVGKTYFLTDYVPKLGWIKVECDGNPAEHLSDALVRYDVKETVRASMPISKMTPDPSVADGLTLPKAVDPTPDRKPYKEYYNPNLIKVVERVFNKDLETFGYSYGQ